MTMGASATDFGRVITAMVTPYDREGRVDYAQAVRLAQRLAAHGTTAVVVSGTTGESPCLSGEEKLTLFREIAQGLRGSGTRVIAGTGNYNTHESIELTREAEREGVDGFLLVVPYYNNPPQEGLYRHFRAIAAATELPCIVYNVPTRTVRNMEASTVARLAADVPNIVGVKEASGNMDQVAEIVRTTPAGFRVWSGNDGDTYTIVCLGGYGVVSVASHLIGSQIAAMIERTVAGDLAAGSRMHLEQLPLARALFPPVAPVASPSPVKAALNMAGFDVGGLRLPLIELPETAQASLRRVLEGYTLDSFLSLKQPVA
jgi:4-hydroxy-tetrahydrodipicolinate synthase